MEITPLENWISRKTGMSGRPDLARLRDFQLCALRDTLRLVTSKSRFYGKRLAGIFPDSVQSMEDVSRLPFTTASDLITCPEDFLCVPPRDIGRIVTLTTSGTTGPPKRLFFTDEDQELTVDFFHHGMTTLAGPGDRVMIFMPGTTPGSVGDLLKKGLARFDCDGIVYGPIREDGDALDALLREHITVIVGIPSQILRLARYSFYGASPKPALKSVLLSADYVPVSVARAIGDAWGAAVYGHYGMTETGLGGGVECAARHGYHCREADLLFEIVDPVSGQPVPDGDAGEVVFSTLTRRGMPLVRYRTGDIARFLTAPCPCGTVLRRLDRVSGRLADTLPLPGGGSLSIAQLDELVYADPSVLSYQAALTNENGAETLQLTVDCGADDFETTGAFDGALLKRKIDGLLGGLVTGGRLALDLRRGSVDFYTTGAMKRRIAEQRQN
jgi:phenylacetate-coenzyme A ligase PaaK-like adenylate-forming protein